MFRRAAVLLFLSVVFLFPGEPTIFAGQLFQDSVPISMPLMEFASRSVYCLGFFLQKRPTEH